MMTYSHSDPEASFSTMTTTNPATTTAPRWYHLIAALLGVLMMAVAASAQNASPRAAFKFPASLQARVEPAVALPGETVNVLLSVTIDEGHYTYGMNLEPGGPVATKATLAPNAALVEIDGEDWIEPPATVKFDTGFNRDVPTHKGTFVIKRAYRVADGAAPGDVMLTGNVQVQVCDSKSCLPPRKLAFETKLMTRAPLAPGAAAATSGVVEMTNTPPAAVAPSPTPTPTATPAPTPTPVATPDAGLDAKAAMTAGTATAARQFGGDAGVADGSLWNVVKVAFLGGLFAILMPCVFPMIPITVAFFTKNAQQSTFKRVQLCSVFSGSIVLGFAVIGFGLALLLKLLGKGQASAGLITQIAASPWLNISLGVLFFIFALSLFGLYEIGLPSWIANRLQSAKGKRSDMIGASLMAMIFVVVSFTCTVPILGLLLPQIFTGNWLSPLVGLTVFAAAFSLPFFFLGLLPQLVSSLPKSGDWLHATKVTMGMVEVAAAFYYFSKADMIWEWNIWTRQVVLAGWAAVGIVAALYLLKIVRFEHENESPIGGGRLIAALFFATLGVYFSAGAYGRPLDPRLEALMPISRSAGASTFSAEASKPGGSSHAAFIQNDLERALEIARKENKPVFVDFTGWTCTNCREMEIGMFPRPEVAGRLDQMVKVALYTDDPVHADALQSYQIERFGTLSIPYYVVLSPDDEVLATFGGLTRNEAEFVEFLDAGLKDTGDKVASR